MSDKVPDRAIEMAREVELSRPSQERGYIGDIPNGVSVDAIAAALLSAYRSGVEDSARVASGQPYLERYRTWPWWKMPDGVGNRANESEIVRHSDDIAAAIRRLGEAE